MPIRIKCSCGKVLRAPDDAAGKKAKCPGCGKVIAIPASEEPVPEEPPAEETVLCAECGAEVEEGAVVCMQCGYNFDTGQAFQSPPAEPSGRSGPPWKLIGIGGGVLLILVLAIGGFMLFRSGDGSDGMGDATARKRAGKGPEQAFQLAVEAAEADDWNALMAISQEDIQAKIATGVMEGFFKWSEKHPDMMIKEEEHSAGETRIEINPKADKLWDIPLSEWKAMSFEEQMPRMASLPEVGARIQEEFAALKGAGMLSCEHEGEEAKVVFSSDEGRFRGALLRKDGIWLLGEWEADVPGPQILCQVEDDNEKIWGLHLLDEGEKLITAGGEVTLWDTSSGQKIRKIGGAAAAMGMPLGSDVSADQKRLAHGTTRGMVRVVDIESGEELKTIKADPTVLAFIPQVDRLATLSDRSTQVRVFDLSGDSKKITRETVTLNIGSQFGRAAFPSLAASPDGERLAACTGTETVAVFNPSTGDREKDLQAEENVWSLAFSPDGKFLATGATIWKTSDWSKVTTIQTGEENRAAVFSPDGRYLLIGASNGKANLYSVGDWKLEQAAPFNLKTGESDQMWDTADMPQAVAFGPAGRTMAASNEDGAIVWDLRGEE